MEKTIAVLIPIAFCICVTLCVYFITRFRYKTITQLGGPIPRDPSNRSWKKIGVVVIGFALGLLTVGVLFYNGFILQSKWNGLFIVGFVTFFVGISLIIAERLEVKDENLDG